MNVQIVSPLRVDNFTGGSGGDVHLAKWHHPFYDLNLGSLAILRQ
jgi:hypothetical protein